MPGINDWGGVSPVTPDHVNPEAPWPHLRSPAARDRSGRQGTRRTACDLPCLCATAGTLARSGLAQARARQGRCGAAGRAPIRGRQAMHEARRPNARPTLISAARPPVAQELGPVLAQAQRGSPLSRTRRSSRLFQARGAEFSGRLRRGGRAARRGHRRHRQLRCQPQHQLHQHLLLSAASSAPSRRASSAKTCAGALTICRLTRSWRGCARRAHAARLKSACRAASIPLIPARPTSRSAGP